ncbi:pilin [Kitasatospora nipponensis]|uniref:pilin n=1 Tax=Kitasatospora nipponensis TaxID=258049 RepID=UPI0031D362A9
MTVVLVLGLLLFAVTAQSAHAQPLRLAAPPTIDQVLTNVTAWITGIVAAVATMFLTFGGLRYLLAGGDPGEVMKAKGALKGAGIGYVIAIMAPVILDVLKNLVGAK